MDSDEKYQGDNFKRSYDSNAFGCVPMGLVVGQAKWIIFPNVSAIKSSLPEHRRLKRLTSSDTSPEKSSQTSDNYLVDFNSDPRDIVDDDDEDEYDEEDDDEDEDEDQNDN